MLPRCYNPRTVTSRAIAPNSGGGDGGSCKHRHCHHHSRREHHSHRHPHSPPPPPLPPVVVGTPGSPRNPSLDYGAGGVEPPASCSRNGSPSARGPPPNRGWMYWGGRVRKDCGLAAPSGARQAACMRGRGWGEELGRGWGWRQWWEGPRAGGNGERGLGSG